MYINSVLSFLGSWQKLQNEHQIFLEGFQRVLKGIDPDEVDHAYVDAQMNLRYTSRDNIMLLNRIIKAHLVQEGWSVDVRIPSPAGKTWRQIDAIFQNVGVEFHFAGYQALLSDLFVTYPIFLQANLFRVPVIVVPASTEMCRINGQRTTRQSTFKRTREVFMGIDPFPLKYPFAILGISDDDVPLNVEEITSQLDQFLIESVGLSLDEMRLLTEQPQFDFKVQLPEGRDFAELVAALANLRGGGIVLIGVNDQGNVVGYPGLLGPREKFTTLSPPNV